MVEALGGYMKYNKENNDMGDALGGYMKHCPPFFSVLWTCVCLSAFFRLLISCSPQPIF